MADVSTNGGPFKCSVIVARCVLFFVCSLLLVRAACLLRLGLLSRHDVTSTVLNADEVDSYFATIMHSQPAPCVGMRTGTRTANTHPSTGQVTTSRKCLVLFGLLLIGVETNPGLVRRTLKPHNNTIKNITTGSLNARSILSIAADFHLTVAEENLDIVAITETWVPLDAPDAVSQEFVPPGYTVINAPGPTDVAAAAWRSSTAKASKCRE